MLLISLIALSACKHLEKKCEPGQTVYVCNGKVFDPNVQECLSDKQ